MLLKRTYDVIIAGSLKRGLLFKKRKRLDWKPRFFVLKEEYLFYFDISTTSDIPKPLSNPLGVIPLRYTQDLTLLSEQEAGRPFSFRLSTSKEAQLAATSQGEAVEWVNLLKSIREMALLQQVSLDMPKLPPSRPPRSSSVYSSFSMSDATGSFSGSMPTLSEEGEDDPRDRLQEARKEEQSPQQQQEQQQQGPPGGSQTSASVDTAVARTSPAPPSFAAGTPLPAALVGIQDSLNTLSLENADQSADSSFDGPPPPPPPFGAPPPPPPFGAAFIPLGPQPTKPEVNPKEKMKPLYWTRILAPPGKGKMIWEDTQEVTVDWDEFEGLFCLKKTKAVEEVTEDAPKKQFTRVLDQKRSQKVAIIKLSLPQTEALKANIEEMEGLSLDQLQQLTAALPEPDEIRMIEDAMVQPGAPPLDLPEQFLLALSKFPFLK